MTHRSGGGAWRSIEEPEDPVVVLRGLPAVVPAAYQRYYGRAARRRAGEFWADLLHQASAFAFSGIVHVLVLILLAEFIIITFPIIEETVLTAQLYRPSPKPDMPSPEPVARKDEAQKFRRAAEAPVVAEVPKPKRVEPARTIGSGSSRIDARPVPLGVMENDLLIPEEDLAHFTGTGLLDARGKAGRAEAVGRFGGNAASEASVELGLRWLAQHQSRDGRWSAQQFVERCPRGARCGGKGTGTYSQGLTGLVLLSFLGAGYTHQEGKYKEVVARGVDWLVGQQDKDGFFFRSAGGNVPGGMYGHGVATFALGEACALTGDPRLRPVLTRAVGAIGKSQLFTGGWGYHPSPASARTSEFTLSVWQMMGLKSALLAGIEVDDAVLQSAMDFVRDSTREDGGVMYHPQGKVTLGATGAGLFARCMFGLVEDDAIDRGLLYLEGFPDQDPELGRRRSWEYIYSWYYRTLVSFQLQGRVWRDWNRKMRPYLVSMQRAQGHAAGSWAIVDYGRAGVVYSTALCVLTLETYYRYLPMVRDRDAVEAVFSAVASGEARVTPREAARLKRILKELEGPDPETEARLREAEIEAARKRIRSVKPEDRYLGARALARLGDHASLDRLIDAVREAPDALKPVHVGYVGKLKSRQAIPFLIGLLGDRDLRVRSAAMSALTTTTGVYIAEVEGWRRWYRDNLDRRAEKE